MSAHGSSTKFLAWVIILYALFVIFLFFNPEYNKWFPENLTVLIFFVLYWISKT